MMKKYTLLFTLFLFGLVYGQQTTNDLQFGPKKESVGKTVDGIVAVVGKDVITYRELNAFPQAQRKSALQTLIMQKLLLQAARKYNIDVGDTAVNMAMEDGSKRPSKKQKFGQANLSRRDRLRNELIIAKLQQKVASNLVTVSDQEINDRVEQQLKSVDDSINLVDVLIKVPQSDNAQVLKQTQLRAKEVIAKLKKQPAPAVAAQYDDVLFHELGWVKLAQIPTSFSKVLVGTPVNQYTRPIVDRDGMHILKIIDRKSKNNKNLPSITQTKTAHILIKDDGNPKAKSTINRIYQRLRKGADFATLAKQYSQDPGSSASGGELGWVVDGQMVPSFEKVMKQTKKGQISKPFRTPFGYHILKVEQRRKSTLSSREALEQQARQAIFQKRAAEEWDLWLSQLRNETYIDIRDKRFR